MKRTLLLSALIAITMTACGKKEEAATPTAAPAPATAPAQAQSDPAAQSAAPAEQTQEEKK